MQVAVVGCFPVFIIIYIRCLQYGSMAGTSTSIKYCCCGLLCIHVAGSLANMHVHIDIGMYVGINIGLRLFWINVLVVLNVVQPVHLVLVVLLV